MKPVKLGSEVLKVLHIGRCVCPEASPDEGELSESPSLGD